GHQEGDVIQHSMITRSIERAQKKVEENNFGIRKRLLEYDDVMNSQRTVIYKQRRQALLGERIGVAVANNTYDVCDSLVAEYQAANDVEGFRMEVLRVLSVDFAIEEEEFKKIRPEELTDRLYQFVRDAYNRKTEYIARQAFPVIKNVFETRGEMYKNIVVPFTDGQKMYNVVTNLEKAYRTNGEELMRSFEKAIILAHIDDAWKEHLREMDDLKQSVQNAAYEQKDPLLIYKFESYNLFKAMVEKINKGMVSALMKAQIPMQEPDRVREADQKRTDLSKMRESRAEAIASSGANREQSHQPVKVGPKVGRNDLCPCGSGLKYKNCHGKNE
nr:SEC-C domain-containing protein [Odoribacter sp.]